MRFVNKFVQTEDKKILLLHGIYTKNLNGCKKYFSNFISQEWIISQLLLGVTLSKSFLKSTHIATDIVSRKSGEFNIELQPE